MNAKVWLTAAGVVAVLTVGALTATGNDGGTDSATGTGTGSSTVGGTGSAGASAGGESGGGPESAGASQPQGQRPDRSIPPDDRASAATPPDQPAAGQPPSRPPGSRRTSTEPTSQPPPGTTTGSTTTQPPAQVGWPSAANTGVPPGTALTVVTGDQTFDTNGQVVTGMDFRGFVRVTGANITFRNSVFRGRATGANAALLDTTGGTGTVVENSEFVPSHPSPTIDGIWAARTSIYRSDVHGSVDGIKAHVDTLVQDSYLHDMSWFASDPNQGGGPTHNDGVQAYGPRVVLRHNRIDMSTTKDANAALQSSAPDSRIENNLLDGGGCTLNFNHKPLGGPLTGTHVVDNRFGRHSFFKCPILLSTQTVLARNSGNVWDDTGEPIPPPQQHD